jgi:hypothetical protein
LASSKKGSLATAAIIALLVTVVGIGIADYYLGSSHVVTDTSVSTVTTSFSAPAVTKLTTKSSFIVLNYTTTQTSPTTLTSVSTTLETVTPKTTLTVVQTKGNVTQIQTAEAVLYGGSTATASSGAGASLLIGFYNPNSTTYITSIVLEIPGSGPIYSWDNSTSASSAANLVIFNSLHLGDTVTGGLTSVFTLYPVTSSAVTLLAGQTYQYVVFFASGVSVEGSLVAQ